MKWLFTFFLAVTVLLIPSVVLAEGQSIKIIIDGEIISSDTSPMLTSNRVLVPVRIISEELGYVVSWDGKERIVYITNGQVKIKFNIDQPKLWNNGNEIELDVTPTIKNGRAYLPIRVVSESIGAIVNWDSATRAVIIETIKLMSDHNTTDKEETLEKLLGTSIEIQSKENQLMVANIFEMTQPNRIVIDFDEVLLEQMTIPGIEENDFIEGIRYSQYELDPNKVRVVIDLKRKPDYTYNISNNSITLNITPHIYKVVIDPGHGGKDAGGIGVMSTKEKFLNLSIALKANSLLKNDPYIESILMRKNDVFISLDDRVEFVNKLKPELFISIHANALPTNSQIIGSETYYTRLESLKLAEIAHKYLLEATGFTDRGVREAGFRVTKNTEIPAVLLEIGYLSNKNEEKNMLKPELQQRVAEGIVKTIREFLY